VHAIAWHLHYICSLFTDRTTLLDHWLASHRSIRTAKLA